jgi:hypothetical protein
METSEASPRELKDEADRLREEIGETADRLRRRLTPSRLLDEWIEASGVKETSAGRILNFAARRHPLPTVLLGLRALKTGEAFRKAGAVRFGDDRQQP